MIDLIQDYFADSEIVSLLTDGDEDGVQTVEDFLYALFSLYEVVPDGEPLYKALIEDWHIFSNKRSMEYVLGQMGNPFNLNDKVGMWLSIKVIYRLGSPLRMK